MRLAVVSPFLDRQHGTEMCIVEQIERLAQLEGWTIDLYSQDVSQVAGVRSASETPRDLPGAIYWHKISNTPGPHLFKFLWWFFINHWRRWQDRRSGRFCPDLVYTPGTNCLDADVIMIQIVFHAFYEQARSQLALRHVPLRSWPRLIHRKLYYQLIMFLERKIYRDRRVRLVAVSNLIARQLETFLGRHDAVVIPNTVDTSRFSPLAWRARRVESRKDFQLADGDFVLLLIGNDWKKKGLDSLLEALAKLRDLPLRLLVVGQDDQGLYNAIVRKLDLQNRISFLNPAADVLRFYAAADLYAGPSLEDGFNLPILEAMACGLPVIASVYTGASENIIDSETGLILSDPHDHTQLAQLIRRVVGDPCLRMNMGNGAARFVQQNCSWDRNAARTRELLEETLRQSSR